MLQVVLAEESNSSLRTEVPEAETVNKGIYHKIKMLQAGRDISGTEPVPSTLERKQLRSLLTLTLSHTHTRPHTVLQAHTHTQSHTHRVTYALLQDAVANRKNPPNFHTREFLSVLKKK